MNFVVDGAERLERALEPERRARVMARYAKALATAGLIGRLVLRFRIAMELRRERWKTMPSDSACYIGGTAPFRLFKQLELKRETALT